KAFARRLRVTLSAFLSMLLLRIFIVDSERESNSSPDLDQINKSFWETLSGVSLRIKAPRQHRLRDLLNAHHRRGQAHVDLFLQGKLIDVIKGCRHDFPESLIDFVFVPKIILQILDPLKIGDDDPPRVGQDVGNEEYVASVVNDLVRL